MPRTTPDEDERTDDQPIGGEGGTGSSEPARSWSVMGRTVTLPVEVRRARQWGVQYLVPAAAAQGIVDPTGLEVTGPVPGRALVALAVCRYDDTDLDPYHEVAVSFVVRPHDAPPNVSAGQRMQEFFSGAIGAYIHRLPVDREFSCAAGRDVWGFPKWVTTIDIDEPGAGSTRAGTGTSVRLVDDGVHVLSLAVAAGGRLRLPSNAPRATPSATACCAAPPGRRRPRASPAGPEEPPWYSVTIRWPMSCAPSDCPDGRCSRHRPR